MQKRGDICCNDIYRISMVVLLQDTTHYNQFKLKRELLSTLHIIPLSFLKNI